jgi:multicomponent Na+:H+ antiporter subunit D
VAWRRSGRPPRHSAISPRSGQLLLGSLLALCALGLAAPPRFGPFLSFSLVQDGLNRAGSGWITVLLTACLTVGAGTVLSAVARVFLGWGTAHDPTLTSQPREGSEEEDNDEEAGRPYRL